MPKLNIVAPPTEEHYNLYKVSCGGVDYDKDGSPESFWTERERTFETFADAEKYFKEVKESGEWGHIQFDCLDIEKGDNYDEDPDDYEELDTEGIECYMDEVVYETNYIFYVKKYLEYEFPKQEMRILEGLAAIYEKTSGDKIQITVDRRTDKWVRGDDALSDFIQSILINMS